MYVYIGIKYQDQYALLQTALFKTFFRHLLVAIVVLCMDLISQNERINKLTKISLVSDFSVV